MNLETDETFTINDAIGSLAAYVQLVKGGHATEKFSYDALALSDSIVRGITINDIRFFCDDNDSWIAVQRVGTDDVISLKAAAEKDVDELFNWVYIYAEYFEEKYDKNITEVTHGLL